MVGFGGYTLVLKNSKFGKSKIRKLSTLMAGDGIREEVG